MHRQFGRPQRLNSRCSDPAVVLGNDSALLGSSSRSALEGIESLDEILPGDTPFLYQSASLAPTFTEVGRAHPGHAYSRSEASCN